MLDLDCSREEAAGVTSDEVWARMVVSIRLRRDGNNRSASSGTNRLPGGLVCCCCCCPIILAMVVLDFFSCSVLEGAAVTSEDVAAALAMTVGTGADGTVRGNATAGSTEGLLPLVAKKDVGRKSPSSGTLVLGEDCLTGFCCPMRLAMVVLVSFCRGGALATSDDVAAALATREGTGAADCIRGY